MLPLIIPFFACQPGTRCPPENACLHHSTCGSSLERACVFQPHSPCCSLLTHLQPHSPCCSLLTLLHPHSPCCSLLTHLHPHPVAASSCIRNFTHPVAAFSPACIFTHPVAARWNVHMCSSLNSPCCSLLTHLHPYSPCCSSLEWRWASW